MNTQTFREFQLLTGISADQSVTQRSLAKSYGLALGLTNLLIRRLVKKGYLNLVNLDRKRVRYLLTPKGVMEKARLTSAYLEYSLFFYRQIRQFLEQAFSSLMTTREQRLFLYGTGEVAEVAFLVIHQRRLQFLGVVEEGATPGATFLGHPIKSPSALATTSYDCVIVASLKNREQAVERLQSYGVPKAHILVIPDVDAAGVLRTDIVRLKTDGLAHANSSASAASGGMAAPGALSKLENQKEVESWI